jgi:uncharacterized protein (TIGR03435 family)
LAATTDFQVRLDLKINVEAPDLLNLQCLKVALLRGKVAAIYLMIFCSWIAASVVHAQDASFAGNRFFQTTITRNEKPLLAAALFNDTEGNTMVLGAPLVAVIGRAYNLPAFKILDGPEWIYTSHLYDIEAVPPPPFINSTETLMLQNMLKDRFNFEATPTTREMWSLTLALDGEGLNLEPVNDAKTGLIMKLLPGTTMMSVTFTLDELATTASRVLNKPVINVTGLTGRYRIELDRSKPADVPSSSKIFSASWITPVIEASGLLVEEKLILTDVLVIEKIDHPVLEKEFD